MSRGLSEDLQEQSKADVVRPIFLVRLDYSTAPVLVCSAPFPVIWNGETYLGVGNLGSLGPSQEAAELQNYAITLTMTGVPAASVAAAIDENYQGRDARIFMALVDDGHRIVTDPLLLFRGRMDTQDIELGTTANITLTVQSRLADWERPRIRRYTTEDQQSEYPDDKGLQYVPQMSEKTLYWGR